MLTTCELTEQIDRLCQSKEALTEFARRLALAFENALTERRVTFHAVNDGSVYSAGNGFDHVVKVCLKSNVYSWEWEVSEGLGWEAKDGTTSELRSITVLSDSELAEIAAQWGDKVAGISGRVVFQNFYLPKAVDFSEGFNDLRIAFRIVRAWDVFHSRFVMRIDAAFKNLAA